MDKNKFKKARRNKIRRRIRSTIRGTSERPRMAVYKSNKHLHVQLVNDLDGVTLFGLSSNSAGLRDQLAGKPGSEQAKMLGQELAKTAKDRGIEKVVFDRSGYKYHGIIKELADAAREGGLDL